MSGGGWGWWWRGTVLTMRVMKPARKPETRRAPTVQTKILRLTMMQPRSTYFFFFCSPGPSSQLCCVSSSGLDRAARSKSCRLRLRSSSVAESAAFISSGPPHGSLPYILIFFFFFPVSLSFSRTLLQNSQLTFLARDHYDTHNCLPLCFFFRLCFFQRKCPQISNTTNVGTHKLLRI